MADGGTGDGRCAVLVLVGTLAIQSLPYTVLSCTVPFVLDGTHTVVPASTCCLLLCAAQSDRLRAGRGIMCGRSCAASHLTLTLAAVMMMLLAEVSVLQNRPHRSQMLCKKEGGVLRPNRTADGGQVGRTGWEGRGGSERASEGERERESPACRRVSVQVEVEREGKGKGKGKGERHTQASKASKQGTHVATGRLSPPLYYSSLYSTTLLPTVVLSYRLGSANPASQYPSMARNTDTTTRHDTTRRGG